MMKRIAFVLMATVALMSVAFVSGAAGHKFKADTSVSIKFSKPKPNDSTAQSSFDGQVDSSKARCVKKRTVTVLMRTSTGTTPVGSDTTDANGAWQVTTTAAVAPGTYFAKVSKRIIRRTAAHRHICRRAVSNDVTVK